MPLSFLSWASPIHARVWVVIFLITYLVSAGGILTANWASGRRGHWSRTINELLVAGQLTIGGYYVNIAVTSELDWGQRWLLITAALLTAFVFVPVGMRNASAKRFREIAKMDRKVAWRVLWPNITLGMISFGILLCVAPKLPQPQLTVRAPSGKPAYLSIESVLPNQSPYDGAPLYVLDHVPHLQAEVASSPRAFAGVIESEKLGGSGHFKWVLSPAEGFRNFSVSVRTAYLVNDDEPRLYQVLEANPRGEPPYRQIVVTIPETHLGDRILVVISLQQVAPGNAKLKDVKRMLEPSVE
jgi:hypothetical protein